ncbi:hypothetical protein LUZ60_012339 [Juncus effusus]|nr:hypothetical protein LUZ60_012339 [Juncus effusus]
MAKQEFSESGLPIKSVPGSYGAPFFSPLFDRLNFYYFQGHMDYFKSHVTKHNSTVVRLNVPPGSFMAKNPHVVAVLDAASYQVLFDSSKVEKRNTFLGTFTPSLSFYSGVRPLSFLDTTDPLHAPLKTLVFRLVASRKMHFIPSFHEVYSSVFDKVENGLNTSGPVEFNTMNDSAAYDFTCGAFFGGALPSVAIGSSAADKAVKWLFFQLHPLVSKISNFLPWPLEDLFLHNFHLPSCLIKSDYKALETYFTTAGKSIIDQAEQLGITRHEALHNIIFLTSFNAYGGIKALIVYILKYLAEAGPELHYKLVQEVRSIVQYNNGSVNPSDLEKMDLVKSVVYEVLRLNPPAEYQYGHAREDLIIESHDTAFKVKKGEMLFGYQPIATRDERIFSNAEKFVPDRFVGEGAKLLKYVYWSNGMETAQPAVSNKQCAGKDMVLLVGRIFIAELFLRYDTFAADIGVLPLEPKITFKSFTKASSK